MLDGAVVLVSTLRRARKNPRAGRGEASDHIRTFA